MPMDAQQAAMWNQSMQTATQAAGVIAQNKLNRKTREWNEKMVNQQREWALADWNMQNEYNSPAAQMARLKAAGLNPNLVYGHGAEAMSASPPRSVSNNSWNPKSPDFGGVAGSLTSGVDLQMKQAQLENMKVQNQLMQTENLRKLSEIRGIDTRTDLTEAQRTRLNQLIEVYGATGMDQAITDLINSQIKGNVMLDQNQMNWIKTSNDVALTFEKVATMELQRKLSTKLTNAQVDEIRQRIQNLQKDGTIKDFEIQLNKTGATRNDGILERQANLIVGKILSGFSQGIKSDPIIRNTPTDELPIPIPFIHKW